MTTRTVTTTDGVRLHLTDEGDGPPVLLLAGYTAAATSWVFQAEALLAAGHRVIALDRRSHGLSEAPVFGHRMARHGKDVDDVLTALDLRDVAVVGGSMGASTAWAYADLCGPERLRGVASIDQTPRMRAADDWPHGFYGFAADAPGDFFTAGPPPIGRGFTPEQQAPGLQRLLDRLGPDGGLRGGFRPETLPLLHDHAEQDWRDVVTRCLDSTPVLMLAARESQYWPCEHAAASLGGHPNGRAVVVDDCGHAANVDRPEAVNAALLTWLEDL